MRNESTDCEFGWMHGIWKTIIGFGPKMMGSAALEECSVFLAEEMKRITKISYIEEYDIQAWRTEGWELEIEGTGALRAYPFLESGASDGFSGTLKWLGKNRLWNMYSWDRYAVENKDGETVAYVTVRGNGEAIPQMLFTGDREIPHFLTGLEDDEQIRKACEEGRQIRGYSRVKREPSKCRNVVGLAGTEKAGKKTIICAHYDTVYNTPGAYDNASGAAVVLELGRRLKEYELCGPIELLLTDGEEFDLTGARNRAKQCRKEDISMVLCIDGVGRDRVLEVWSGPEPLERRIRKSLEKSKEDFSPVYHCPPPPGSDQEAFYSMGIPACMLTFNDQGILHSPKDIYEENKLCNMKTMVRLALGLLEDMGIICRKEKEI